MLPKDQFGEAGPYVEYDEETMRLSELLPSLESVIYHYGDLDGWDHVITTGEITNADDGPYVACTGGQGAVPLEAYGGAASYEEKCAIFRDTPHDEHEEMQDVLGVYLDLHFDKARINEELKDLLFTPKPC